MGQAKMELSPYKYYQSVTYIVGCYVCAIGVAVISPPYLSAYFQLEKYLGEDNYALLAAFLGDIVATLWIFLSSFIVNNSSVYDPYWSIAPAFVIVYWAAEFGGRDAPRTLLFFKTFK